MFALCSVATRTHAGGVVCIYTLLIPLEAILPRDSTLFSDSRNSTSNKLFLLAATTE